MLRLNYFAERSAGWRRRVVLTLVIGVVALIACGLRCIDLVHRHVRRWMLCRQCMQFHIPPGTVLWTDDPARIKQVLSIRSEYIAWGEPGQPPLRAVYAPRVFRDYAPYLGLVGRDPSDEGNGITFCGTRTTPGGSQRLVILSRGPEHVSDLPDGGWWFDVAQPATLFGSDPTDIWGWTNSFNYANRQGWNVTWHPGVPDAKDLSHFTIDFTLLHGSYVSSDNSESHFVLFEPPWHGTLDVYLQNDDHLRFVCRYPWCVPESKVSAQ